MSNESQNPDTEEQVELCADHYDAVYDHYKKAFEGLDHIVLSDFDSNGPPVNIHVVSPPDAPFRVLLTEGMSVAPMRSPFVNKRFMELSLLVPKRIHFISETLLETHPHRWIVEMMRFLARFPHMHGAVLDSGHSVQADDNPYNSFGENCPFNAAILLPSTTLWDELTSFVTAHGPIRILSILTLHPDEMTFRIHRGLNALMDNIVEGQVTELLDIDRPNLCPPEEE